MCHCEGCTANKENALDRLTRDQLSEIVNAAISGRDREEPFLTRRDPRADEERRAALGELSDTLDRYGL